MTPATNITPPHITPPPSRQPHPPPHNTTSNTPTPSSITLASASWSQPRPMHHHYHLQRHHLHHNHCFEKFSAQHSGTYGSTNCDAATSLSLPNTFPTRNINISYSISSSFIPTAAVVVLIVAALAAAHSWALLFGHQPSGTYWNVDLHCSKIFAVSDLPKFEHWKKSVRSLCSTMHNYSRKNHSKQLPASSQRPFVLFIITLLVVYLSVHFSHHYFLGSWPSLLANDHIPPRSSPSPSTVITSFSPVDQSCLAGPQRHPKLIAYTI